MSDDEERQLRTCLATRQETASMYLRRAAERALEGDEVSIKLAEIHGIVNYGEGNVKDIVRIAASIETLLREEEKHAIKESWI